MLLNDLLVGVGTVSTYAFLLFLLDRLLDLKNILPKIHNLYIGSMAIMLIGAFFVTTEYYGYFARLSFFLVVPAVGVGLIVLTMIMIREGIKPFLAVCYLAFLVALIVGTLRISLILGGAPRSILSDANYQIAFLFHVLLLALGFAIRILEIERDRSQAHEEARLSAIDAEEQRQFVGMLSHEFRAPLEDIEKAALAVEASDAFFPDKVKERLGRIRGQSQQLAAMVNSFLVAEAFKHGILALKKDNISLETLLCGIVERYAELIPPWRLSYRVTPPGLQAELDGEMIEIAIGNLVANALRYSSPETSVRVSAAAAAGALLISVNDQGAGMSKEEVSHMGEMYFRAQSSKGTKGTGLGLHMTKMIITAHGGSWQIDSQIGKGTRIAIRLPQNKTGATA
jgi:signal transduction histidine kinase